MSGELPPRFRGNMENWGRQVSNYLARVRDALSFRTSDSRATQNGLILWDEDLETPVVSFNGEWYPIYSGRYSMDFGVQLAQEEIENTYGDAVSVYDKKKTLLKFGKKVDLGTSFETVWQTNGNETYVTTNAIDTVSSSDATDTMQVAIEGHTVSGTGTSSQFTFVTQTATLNGQNKVTLSTPLARVSRMYVNDQTEPAGDIHVYEDTTITAGVPNDLTKAHIVIKGTDGETQSFKCATTFSNSDYFICTGGFASVDKKTNATVDFEFQVRRPGGVFRPVSRLSLGSASQNSQQIQFYPYVIIPKNADIRIVGVASTTGVAVSAQFQGFIAQVTS